MAQVKSQDIVQYGPYGNQESATTFNFVMDSTERIQNMKIASGSIVDGIGFDIIDQSGNIETRYYGGPGHEQVTIKLQDNEYITHISGFVGDFAGANNRRHVVQIMIYTNLNTQGIGPYGRMRDCKNIEPFETPAVANGGRIVGFLGATGSFLESIGVYNGKN